MVQHLLVTCLVSLGMAVSMVEMGDKWPVKPVKYIIKWMLGLVHSNLPNVLDCMVCFSFWAALLTETILGLMFGFACFSWPVSGFAAVAATWVIVEFLNALGPGESP